MSEYTNSRHFRRLFLPVLAVLSVAAGLSRLPDPTGHMAYLHSGSARRSSATIDQPLGADKR